MGEGIELSIFNSQLSIINSQFPYATIFCNVRPNDTKLLTL